MPKGEDSNASGREDVLSDLRKEIDRRIDQVRTLDESVEKMVKERPLLVLGVTFAMGFLLGMILGRKSQD